MYKPAIKGLPESGAHSVMQAWADSQARKPLAFKIEYLDGSVDDYFEVAKPATKEVVYKIDWEVYSVSLDTAKFNADWLDLWNASKAEVKKAFIIWLNDKEGYKTLTEIR